MCQLFSMASPICDEDDPETARANEEVLDLIEQWNMANPERDIVVVVAGKSGTGKSTLINNFLTLGGTKAADTRLQPTSVTTKVERYDGEVNGVRIRAIDMPGLHALDDSDDVESAQVIAALTHVTDGEADILIYCVSLTQRLDFIDKKNIDTLIKAFGKKVWDNSILILTHADSVLEDEDTNFDELVEKFTKELHRILIKYEVNACITYRSFSSCHTFESHTGSLDLSSQEMDPVDIGMEVATHTNVVMEHEDGDATSDHDPANAPDTESRSTSAQELQDLVEIAAIPIGKRLLRPPGWRESLLAQVITICRSRAVSKLTQLEGISWGKVKKKVKKGVKAGAVAGVIGGASGTVVGAAAGSAIGAAIGGALTAPIGGLGALPTAAGGAILGAIAGSLFGGGGTGSIVGISGGIGSARNNDLFKDIEFWRRVEKKLNELHNKELKKST